MNKFLLFLIPAIGAQAFTAMAAEPASDDLAPDSPLRADRPAGWVAETIGATVSLRYHQGDEDALRQPATTADLVLAIADARNKSPLPLRSILLGGYLTRCDSLQLYLQRELEKRHPLSLLKGTARPGDMPVQGEESAPPLGPLALQVVKKSPDLKEIEKALEATGHRIKDITWDDFETVGATGRMGFKGNVTVLVEPAMAK